MNVLAFDTCYSACSVAVRLGAPGDEKVFSERQMLEAGHAEALMPMIDRVMREAGIAFGALERIVFTLGPGTFTGVRTAVAAARGLRLATGTPVVAISSLWAIGAAAAGTGRDRRRGEDGVLVAMDARKDQFHVQVVDRDERELTEPMLLDAVAAAALCPGRSLLAVGTGAHTVAAAAQEAGRLILTDLDERAGEMHYQPDAVVLLRAADRMPCLGSPLPLYLRPPDVKPQANKSLPWSQ